MSHGVPTRTWVLGALATLIAVGWAAGATAADEQSRNAVAARLPFQIVPGGSADVRRAPAVAAEKPLPLAPPRANRKPTSDASKKNPAKQSMVTVASSLAVVLGLFGLLVWFTRRQGGKAIGGLPGDVVQTLGRAPLNKQQELHLVRIGNKLLLLAVTPSSAETLTEITDAQEIQRLTNLCQQSQPGNLSASFRQVLAQLNREPEPDRAFATARY